MTQLKALDGLATEALALRNSDLRPARRQREEDLLVYRISEVLKPTVRKMLRNKGMLDILDEGEQHGFIAIHAALNDWDATLSSFSTHVHWKLRAEMRTLELHHFPERRKVCENIDVQMIHLNKTCQEGSESNLDEIGNVMNLDPEGYLSIEENVDAAMFRRNVEHALSTVAYPRVMAYIAGGFTDKGPVEKVMRDIHIYIQRNLADENANIVASTHAITRERIRQITNKVEKVFEKNIKSLMDSPRLRTPEEDIAWELALSIYNEHANYDIRLLDGVPYVDEDKVSTMERGHEPLRNSEDIEYEIRKNNEGEDMKAMITLAAAAGVAIAAPQLEAQEPAPKSRAIPPKAERIKEIEIIDEPAPVKVTVSEEQAFVASGKNEWAIKVGEHPTPYAVRKAADSLIRQHPELKGISPRIIKSRNGESLSLAFGTLDLPRATQVCNILEKRGENCVRIRVGDR